MLILKKLKGKPIIFFSLLLTMSSLSFASISKANDILTEDASLDTANQDVNSKKIFDLFLEDDSYIEIVNNEDNLILNKFNSSNNIFSKELPIKENYRVENILPIKEYGFVLISNYSPISINEENSNENNNEDIEIIKSKNSFNLLAFNTDGDLLNSVFSENISNELLFKFVTDSFDVVNEDIKTYVNTLSSEDIYNLSIYLVGIAESTLAESDINKAKNIIDMISNPIKRDELLLKLNIIANQSIEEELGGSFGGTNTEFNSSSSIMSDSHINLSVDTNNIIFDYLNISEDTVLNKAITLQISSSLPYDINVSIEGGITSGTNSTNLSNSVFSIKESNSDNFLTFNDTGVVTILQNQPQGDAVSHSIDLRLNTKTNIIKDVYKAVFKIEAITK